MNLEDLRREIDQIDSQMLELFVRRMNLSEDVTQQKIEQNLPVFNADRENQVLRAAQNNVPSKFSGYVTDYICNLMTLSKNLQRDIIRSSGLDGSNAFLQLLNGVTSQAENPKITVQGTCGSYSTAAANQMYPGKNVSYVDRWEDVFSEVSNGFAKYGILPLENSTAGSVTEVYDLLLRNNLYIVKTADLKIGQCLLGVRGSKLSDIRKVYSHPHAFPQCAGFFNSHHRMEKIPFINTAMAAKMVAENGSRQKAAVASRDCAHLYGLDILCENIEDNHDNCTRFISISKSLEIPGDANKISIIFSLPHVTGSLCRLLERFAFIGLNITKIESRPNHEKPFEYYFYLDFIGSIKSKNTVNLLASLSEELPKFYFLGNYNEQAPAL